MLFELSREAKELACHAIEKFLAKFDKNGMYNLVIRINCFYIFAICVQN